MYKCVFLATCNAILVLKNVISKERLTCEETFIVKFGKDVCLAICQFYSSKRVELREKLQEKLHCLTRAGFK